MFSQEAGQKTVSSTLVLGVEYKHLTLENGDELYLTEYGRPLEQFLLPENFYPDEPWFLRHSEKLRGTSCIYRVKTKKIKGRRIDFVLKWNRMGQDVPGVLEDSDLLYVEFNSPFEEFAYVMELRGTSFESPGWIMTHKPLAIYMPAGEVELDLLGRSTYKMKSLVSKHHDVELNINRSYAMIYEWVKGIDVVQACREGLLSEKQMEELTLQSRERLKRKGFEVADSKPHHLILRKKGERSFLRDRSGDMVYALVDFELLKRTREREEELRMRKRRIYLEKQAHRFEERDISTFPPQLKRVEIMGVDYVYGNVEATGGRLWVVGKDPSLFDYFLPEKWRKTPRIKLSVLDQVYRTTTTDNIHLIWRVSRVGEVPDMDPLQPASERIIDHGYNSPFEEVALANHLSSEGVPTTYPRAIYMASSKARLHDNIIDDARYETHKKWTTPDGRPVLEKYHDYIIFWGFWNGPDEMLAKRDESLFEGLEVLLAYRKGLLDKATYMQLMEKNREMLLNAGIKDLNPLGIHILVSVDYTGHLVRDADGVPEIRITNFEFLTNTERGTT